MKNPDCLFCKIVDGEIPSHKVRENDEFYAFLDLFPNCKGQTLVIPKEHFDSDFFMIEDFDFYTRYLQAVREVARLLKSKLGVQRVGMIMEGMGVNHLHIKLYPMRGLTKGWKPEVSKDEVFYETYPGFLTTKLGSMASQESLSELGKFLRGEN
jgi:histidine triad protein